MPRARRGATGGQGLRRPGRRHHQLPLRYMSAAAETSVIVPAFNEGLAIRQVITALQSAAPWREIIVVDDGSSDSTAAEATAAGAQVIRHPYNKGNGAAVKTGLRHATGPFLLVFYARGQHTPPGAL